MTLSFPAAGTGGPRALQATTQRLERGLAQLASGQRIATASDDAAGLAIAQRLSAQVASLAQGERNLADGQGLVRVAEGALQGSQDNLARMRELAVQAGNGTLSAADRATLQDEYDQLAQQLTQTAGSTQFGGTTLLDGSASGSSAPAITDGAGGSTAVDVPDVRASALGVEGLTVGAPATLDALDAASSQLSSVRSSLGAFDAQFERSAAVASSARENADAARSRILDVDVASAVASRTRDRILQSLQIAVLVHAGQDSHGLDRIG